MFRAGAQYFAFLILGLGATDLAAQSVGGTTSGGASYCTSSNAGFISLAGSNGSIAWEQSTNGGATWTPTGNTTVNQSYFNISQTTCYRAVVTLSGFPPDTSTTSCVTIYAPTVAGTISGGATFCLASGTGSLNLTGNTGNVLNWMQSTDGGATWTNISNTSTSLTYTNITQNTLFEAVVQNSSFCLKDTSAPVAIAVDTLSNAGSISVSAGNDSACFVLNNGAMTLSGSNGSVVSWLSSTDNGVTWSPIANTTTTQPYNNLLVTTWYEAIVQNGVCPADTTDTPQTITVIALPTVYAGPDSTIQPGQSITLQGSGSGTPFWMPSTTLSSAFSYTPVASPTVTTSYILVVTGFFGCLNADTVIINVTAPTFTGSVSSFFTPNNDGVNDTWYIQNIQNFPDNEVRVYNIYGNLVYNQKTYVNDWKGTYNGADLPDGTYYYILTFDKTDTIRKGSVDILRKK